MHSKQGLLEPSNGAGEGTRTLDIQLGKLTLIQTDSSHEDHIGLAVELGDALPGRLGERQKLPSEPCGRAMDRGLLLW